MSFDLEELYDKIYRYCYFKLCNREIAEDLTQETFLRYFEKDPGLQAESALKYLYTIARNLCIDEYRRSGTAATETLDEAEPGDVAAEEQILMRFAVKAALAKLNEEERELLLLRYVNEVPVAAIGKIMGISRFSVYRQLKAASKKFREELRKEELHE